MPRMSRSFLSDRFISVIALPPHQPNRCSRILIHAPRLIIRWSSTSISSNSPAWMSVRVTSISSGLACVLPDRWLCATMVAALLSCKGSRNSSHTRTTDEFKLPLYKRWRRCTWFLVSRHATQDSSFYDVVVPLFPILRCVCYRALCEIVPDQPHESHIDGHLDVFGMPSIWGIDHSLCCCSTYAEHSPKLRKGHIWFGSRSLPFVGYKVAGAIHTQLEFFFTKLSKCPN